MTENKTNTIDDDIEKKPQLLTFGEHLEELRSYLIKIIIVFSIAFVVLLFFKDFLFQKIILAPKESWFFTNNLFCKMAAKFNIEQLCINTSPLKLINIELAGQFSAHLLITLVAAFVLTFPYILRQLWLFTKPALFISEIKKLKFFVFISSLLFFIGVMFGYFIIVPLTINFLGNYNVAPEVKNTISLMSYVSSVSIITLIMGVVFEMPLLIYFVSKAGLISPEFLRKNRKIIIVIIFVLAALITPPDAFSQILVAIPMYALYEISIFISYKKN